MGYINKKSFPIITEFFSSLMLYCFKWQHFCTFQNTRLSTSYGSFTNTLHFVSVELGLKEGKERNLLIVEFATDTASFVRKEQTANLLEVGSLQAIFQVTN